MIKIKIHKFYIITKKKKEKIKKSVTFYFRLPYFETSACSSANVEKSVDCLLDLVMQRIQQSVKHTRMPLGDSKGIILDADTTSSYCSYC